MRVFVSEFVCGGGWPESNVPRSLAAEGGAMLRALCEDCARLPDVHVVTTRDARRPLPLPSSVEVVDVASREEEWERFLELAVAADASIVVAPELDDLLTSRIRSAREAGASVLAPPTEVVELCSDKLRLAQFLRRRSLRTIPTAALSVEAPSLSWEGRVVVKPRFGAGSQGVVTTDSTDLKAFRSPESAPPASQRIVQPLIKGRSFSVGALYRSPGRAADSQCDLLPRAVQSLSADGRFRYLAGSVPAPPAPKTDDATATTIDACRTLLPGLAGYVGFDFVVPDDSPDEPLLVEINPRLCTSYLGYRALTDENLAGRMLNDGPHGEIVWKSCRVDYFPNGETRIVPTRETPRCA